MKLKLLLSTFAALAALHVAHRWLNGGNLARGSLESVESSDRDGREKFQVGFLPVT
jgi:hypothetical protein